MRKLILIFFMLVACLSRVKTQVILYEEDSTGSHYLAVKAAFLTVAGYLNPTVNFKPSSPETITGSPYLLTNHSYTVGSSSISPIPVSQYRTTGVLPIIAHSANSSIVQNYPDPESCIRVAAIDAGGENNNTSYGIGLDFVEKTPECGTPCQSYATPRVMGKFYVIKHKLDSIHGGDVSWSEVFYRAKRTASNNNIWNERTGWGVIDVNAAVAYDGTLSPYEPLEEYVQSTNYIDTLSKDYMMQIFDLTTTKQTSLWELARIFDTFRKRSGVATGTTDGSGDLTITFSSVLPDNTYSLIVTPKGTTYYTTTYHTETTGSVKVRFFDAAGAAVTATSVTISYEAKDY